MLLNTHYTMWVVFCLKQNLGCMLLKHNLGCMLSKQILGCMLLKNTSWVEIHKVGCTNVQCTLLKKQAGLYCILFVKNKLGCKLFKT